jgi:hypothetical protein
MRKSLLSFCLFAPLTIGAAELAGTWKYTAPPNPNAKGNQRPAETVYVIKVDGKNLTGKMLVTAACPTSSTALSTDLNSPSRDGKLAAARRRTKASSMAAS